MDLILVLFCGCVLWGICWRGSQDVQEQKKVRREWTGSADASCPRTAPTGRS